VFALVLTFFKFVDVPVFWPILLLYWAILFFVTMKRQIRHMIKYRYVPFSWGKQVCATGGAARLPKHTVTPVYCCYFRLYSSSRSSLKRGEYGLQCR
jgi:hypothetical protein